MTLFLLIVAAAFLLALSALPGVIIKRRARRYDVEAVASFRDTLPTPAETPLTEDLDAKWEAYWAASDRESLVLATRLVDYAADVEARVDTFAHDCELIIREFTRDAVRAYHSAGNRFGGWANDVERTADRIVERVNHDLVTFAHELAVERAECTETRWTENDAAMLREYEAALS